MDKILSYLFFFAVSLVFTACNSVQEIQLIEASARGDLSTVQQLLAQGTDIDAQRHYSFGETVSAGMDRKNSMDPNPLDRTTRATPLIQAAWNNRYDVTKYLLDKGAKTEKKKKDGSTALALAVFNKYFKVADLLLQHGAKINTKDNDGKTPLISAASSGNSDAVVYLVTRGANLNLSDSLGYTAINWAAANNKAPIVYYLCSKGAKLEKGTNSDHWTPLMQAVDNNNLTIAAILLKFGADAGSFNWSYNPLSHANKKGYTEMEQLLRSYGAREAVGYVLTKHLPAGGGGGGGGGSRTCTSCGGAAVFQHANGSCHPCSACGGTGRQ